MELQQKISTVIAGDTLVRRTSKVVAMLELDVPPWVGPDEVRAALYKHGLNEGDGRFRPVRTGQNGFRTCRVDVPVEVAARLARLGRISVTWTLCRVKVLPATPLQCHKCFKFGHLQRECKEDVDRQNTC